MDGTSHVSESFSKKERLCGKKEIENLLSKGRFGVCGHFKFCVFKGNGLAVHRVLISVSKKSFKRAVKRNLLKRRIRESYRRQKALLPAGGGYDILFIYNTKELLPYSEIFDNIGNILKRVGGNDER